MLKYIISIAWIHQPDGSSSSLGRFLVSGTLTVVDIELSGPDESQRLLF